eukprot:2963657-Rhodomonas_salina.1
MVSHAHIANNICLHVLTLHALTHSRGGVRRAVRLRRVERASLEQVQKRLKTHKPSDRRADKNVDDERSAPDPTPRP